MISFSDYLKRQDLTRASIESCQRAVNLFMQWLSKQAIRPDQVIYTDVLAYMKHCQKKGVTQRTIQNYLGMVRHFYDYLIEQHQTEVNPVTGIKVQGVKRKTLYPIFQPAQLHAIYNSFEAKTLTDKRDKVMLGLLIYQGLRTQELAMLVIKDVKVKEGKIQVPASRKGNERTLQLESHQVLEMYDYLLQVRKEIQEQSGRQSNKLFIGLDGGEDMSNFSHYLMVKVGRKYKGIVNPKQIRASVIVKWLRQYNLREVQYLAGHRYISSTEAYQQSEMEGLTEEVNKFHPLG